MKKDSRRIALELREGFVPSLKEAFAARFDGLEIETYWNLTVGPCGGYISSLTNGEAFNEEQVAFIAGFEAAWLFATTICG